MGKDELQSVLWPDVVVTEASLTRCVAKCRQALGDDGDQQTIIKTVHGRGYRFVASLENTRDENLKSQQVKDSPAQNTTRPSIAVLPFVNASQNPEDDIFADGLTEDIIVDLSCNGWLYVIGRNSSFSYKGQVVHSSVVAEELGVCYVLEGSVRKLQNQLRVSVELVDAQRGTQEWAQNTRETREMAKEYGQKALDIAPDDPIKASTEAIARSPRDPGVSWYLTMLCWAHTQLDQFEEAITNAQKAVVHYNGWHATWISLGLALACHGKLDKAREAIQRGRSITSSLTLKGYSNYFTYVSRDAEQAQHRCDLLAEIWE